MQRFRVTKYDPQFRDGKGAYMREEWNSYADLGRFFDGKPLTQPDYERVEGHYITAATRFLGEAGVPGLRVKGLENTQQSLCAPREGDWLTVGGIATVARDLLREAYWCRLEGENAYLHFGWDFYMYLGVPRACPVAQKLAQQLGLYVEPFDSPYMLG